MNFSARAVSEEGDEKVRVMAFLPGLEILHVEDKTFTISFFFILRLLGWTPCGHNLSSSIWSNHLRLRCIIFLLLLGQGLQPHAHDDVEDIKVRWPEVYSCTICFSLLLGLGNDAEIQICITRVIELNLLKASMLGVVANATLSINSYILPSS